MRSPILSIFLVSSVVTLGITHLTAEQFSLYWKYSWLDLATHALGGVCVALLFLLTASYIRRIPKRYFTLIPTLSFVLVIGLLWELFEIQVGFALLQPDFLEDMSIDLVMDILGGTLGYVVGSRVRSL